MPVGGEVFKCCGYVPYCCVGDVIVEVECGSGAYQVFVEVDWFVCHPEITSCLIVLGVEVGVEFAEKVGH